MLHVIKKFVDLLKLISLVNGKRSGRFANITFHHLSRNTTIEFATSPFFPILIPVVTLTGVISINTCVSIRMEKEDVW